MNSNKNNQPQVVTNALTLGPVKLFSLTWQMVFAIFGAVVLVAKITGLSVQVTLICAGIGTLGAHLITGRKVPLFLGSSFAFLGGYASVMAMDTGIYADMSQADKLRYASGGAIVAGSLYLVLAGFIALIGVKRVMKLFHPVVTGTIILCIGLTLLPSAAANVMANPLIALIALGTVIYCNIWGKGMIKIVPILMAVLVSYVSTLILQATGAIEPLIDTAAIGEAAWFGLPQMFPFVIDSAHLPAFEINAIMAMAPNAIPTMMEHIGDMLALGAVTGANYILEPGLVRTLAADGLMTMLAAFLLGPPNTSYGESTSTTAMSGVHDPLIQELAAGVTILLGFSPKLAYIIDTMPTAIIGGISLILYGMISSIGQQNIVENRVDFKNPRNLTISALILGASQGFTDGITMTVFGTELTITGLALGAIVGLTANAVLPGNDYEFGKNPAGDENIGPYHSR